MTHSDHGNQLYELSDVTPDVTPHDHHDTLQTKSQGGGSHSTLLHGGSAEEFLFYGLRTQSPNTFFIACIFLVLLTCGLEIAKYYLSLTETKLVSRLQKFSSVTPIYSTFSSISMEQRSSSENDAVLKNSLDSFQSDSSSLRNNWHLWIISGLGHFCSYFLGVLLMLIAMTYNIYLILCLSLGSSIGKIMVLNLKKRSQRLPPKK